MKIRSLNDAMEILQRDTPLSKLKASIGEDISIDAVLDNSGDYITDSELAHFLSVIIDEIGFSKAEVMKRAGLNDVLGFQIFSGITLPTFNTLMRICIGANFNLTETQRAIELAGFTPLDPECERDVVLIHGIMYMKSIRSINQTLNALELTPL